MNEREKKFVEQLERLLSEYKKDDSLPEPKFGRGDIIFNPGSIHYEFHGYQRVYNVRWIDGYEYSLHPKGQSHWEKEDELLPAKQDGWKEHLPEYSPGDKFKIIHTNGRTVETSETVYEVDSVTSDHVYSTDGGGTSINKRLIVKVTPKYKRVGE